MEEQKECRRRISDRSGGSATVIGEGAVIRGFLGGDESYVVFGRVEGDCDVGATLVVERSGAWHGDIAADSVVIAGTVHGDVLARTRLEVAGSARIQGRLTGAAIAIAAGAVCEGEVHTLGSGEVSYFHDRRRGGSD